MIFLLVAGCESRKRFSPEFGSIVEDWDGEVIGLDYSNRATVMMSSTTGNVPLAYLASIDDINFFKDVVEFCNGEKTGLLAADLKLVI